MDFDPIALIAGAVLLVSGAGFALFLGVSSSRNEASRHEQAGGH